MVTHTHTHTVFMLSRPHSIHYPRASSSLNQQPAHPSIHSSSSLYTHILHISLCPSVLPGECPMPTTPFQSHSRTVNRPSYSPRPSLSSSLSSSYVPLALSSITGTVSSSWFPYFPTMNISVLYSRFPISVVRDFRYLIYELLYMFAFYVTVGLIINLFPIDCRQLFTSNLF